MSRFDKVADEWDKKDIRLMIAKQCAEAIKKHVPLQSSMKVMDFGAGTGLLSFDIAPHVHQVVAVDTSEKMLQVLLSKNSEGCEVIIHHGDIMHLPIAHDFDGVVSSMAMHHVEDTERFLKSLYAHLKPGGFIAICDLDKEDGSFHSHGNEGVHHLGFDQQELAMKAEKAGFGDVCFHEAMVIEKESGSYPVFLMHAVRM
jgi:ubiquinone/menaquinone biosynthesis C-methylase UbiE